MINLIGVSALTLAGADEAMPGIQVELGMVVPAGDEIAVFVHKLSGHRIERKP